MPGLPPKSTPMAAEYLFLFLDLHLRRSWHAHELHALDAEDKIVTFLTHYMQIELRWEEVIEGQD